MCWCTHKTVLTMNACAKLGFQIRLLHSYPFSISIVRSALLISDRLTIFRCFVSWYTKNMCACVSRFFHFMMRILFLIPWKNCTICVTILQMYDQPLAKTHKINAIKMEHTSIEREIALASAHRKINNDFLWGCRVKANVPQSLGKFWPSPAHTAHTQNDEKNPISIAFQCTNAPCHYYCRFYVF